MDQQPWKNKYRSLLPAAIVAIACIGASRRAEFIDARPFICTTGFVQVVENSIAVNNTSLTNTFAAAQAARNHNLVGIRFLSSGTVSAVTDTQGNTYSFATNVTDAGGTKLFIYYCPGIAGGTNQVKVTFTANANPIEMLCAEYSTCNANTLDKATTATGTSSFPNSGNVTTTVNAELLVGFAICEALRTWTNGTGYTVRYPTVGNNSKVSIQDKFVTSTGTYNSTNQLGGGSTQWGSIIVTF